MSVCIMTNAEIYGLSQALNSAFNSDERYLPARINFFIQKNRNTLAQIVEIIENARMQIISHYGNPSEEGYYNIPEEKIPIANKELADLLNVSQEVNISTVKLSDLEGLDFISSQMQALLFMIEED